MKPSNTTNYFDSDEDEISEQEPDKLPEVIKTSKAYEDSFSSYLKYFKEYIGKCEEMDSDIFKDGARYVNHPLIQITQITFEKNIGLFDILKLDGRTQQLYERTAILFTYLDNQVSKIRELLESSLLDSLMIYGERAENVELVEGEAELQTARMLGVYKKIYDLIRKLMSYVEHTIVQLHCIVNKKQTAYKNFFKGINMYYPIEIIGKALRIIYVIDSIVCSNDNIIAEWNQYKKLVKMAKTEPDKFGTTAKQAKAMEKLIVRLDNTLLSGKCFQMVISMSYDGFLQKSKSDLGLFKNNKELRELFQVYFNETRIRLAEIIGSNIEKEERTRLLELMCVYAFFRRMYPADEQRDLWKDIWEIQKKIPIIESYSYVSIYISDFLTNICPLSRPAKTRDPKDPKVFLKSYIERFDSLVPSEINSLYTQVCIWVSRMESIVTSNYSLSEIQRSSSSNPKKVNDIIVERINNRLSLLGSGILLISQLRRVLYSVIMLHVNQEVGFTKTLVGCMILGLQSIKMIQKIMREKSQAFDTTLLTKFVARDIDAILRPIYDRVYKEETSKKKPDRLEILACMKKFLEIISTPISEFKLSLLRYSLTFLPKSLFKDNEIADLRKLVDRLELVNQSRIILDRYSNCSFMWIAKELLPTLFQWKRDNPNSCKRLQYLFDSFDDASNIIHKCAHLSNPHEVFTDYKRWLLDCFEKNYMLPLKLGIEDFLRINVHFMILDKAHGQNPFKTDTKDLLKLVQLEELRIFDSIIDIRTQITKYLNEKLYNMNTSNMPDVEIYEQIRTMGNYLFGLNLQNAYLPSQTIQQDHFNIMAISDNIPAFMARYKYNMFTQTFLEMTSDAKQISSIGIRQLSDSIKTHGLGSLNSTVNKFYRYLVKKINNFNRFMFDDMIQSPLIKEKNWLREASQKQDYQGFYPFERAESFYDKMKKLGKLNDDKTFLEKFRSLITDVGNVLGFVRLLRSASLNFCSKSIEFLPKKIQLQQSIAEIAANSTLSQLSVTACGDLDDIFKSLEQSFSDRADYLNLMIKSFSKLASKQNKHLKLFYLIIPALTINYVQSMLIGKEQINKRISNNAFINDDGFVLGLAYFLALLKQNEYYTSLHWITAVQTKFERDIQEATQWTERVDRSKRINQDMNMLRQLSLRKLEMEFEEFQMFHHTLTAAKILFRQEQPVLPTAPVAPPSDAAAASADAPNSDLPPPPPPPPQ